MIATSCFWSELSIERGTWQGEVAEQECSLHVCVHFLVLRGLTFSRWKRASLV